MNHGTELDEILRERLPRRLLKPYRLSRS